MKSLDEIDDINLNEKEVKTRKFAKYASLTMTLMGYYVIMFPILLFASILDKNFISSIMMPIVETCILKPTRWLIYQFVYYPSKLIFQAVG